jgi:hypothetical protein
MTTPCQIEEAHQDQPRTGRRTTLTRVIAVVLFTSAMSVALGMLATRVGPQARQMRLGMCDRMLAAMPDSFPPNRMMADLEAVKEQTARILELLEERTGDKVDEQPRAGSLR